jgi:type III pantothenate kinase
MHIALLYIAKYNSRTKNVKHTLLDALKHSPYILCMLLAIDIGNTNTVIGVFDGDKLISHFRVASALNLTVDEAGMFVTSLFNHHIRASAGQIDRVAICSVVPRLTEVYEKMTPRYFKVEPFTISSKVRLPFKIDYKDPTEVGADRLANAAAGYARFNRAFIIVDLGTATTFDIVSDNGDYMGGIIAPGPETAGAGLARKAARLFEVRIEKPDSVIGKTTAEAIKSGLFHGTIGMIDNILEKIFDTLGSKPSVIATGGEADIYAAQSKYISQVIPALTLEGIRIISEYNVDQKQ